MLQLMDAIDCQDHEKLSQLNSLWIVDCYGNLALVFFQPMRISSVYQRFHRPESHSLAFLLSSQDCQSTGGDSIHLTSTGVGCFKSFDHIMSGGNVAQRNCNDQKRDQRSGSENKELPNLINDGRDEAMKGSESEPLMSKSSNEIRKDQSTDSVRALISFLITFTALYTTQIFANSLCTRTRLAKSPY